MKLGMNQCPSHTLNQSSGIGGLASLVLFYFLAFISLRSGFNPCIGCNFFLFCYIHIN